MPKQRETEQQHMDRLRKARGLPPVRTERDLMMDRTRAAVAYIGTAFSPSQAEAMKMHAFMDIFHPEVPKDRVHMMAHHAADRVRR